ncbi:hypothetical protein MRX96_015198 [Rhipicephalus microplus]
METSPDAPRFPALTSGSRRFEQRTRSYMVPPARHRRAHAYTTALHDIREQISRLADTIATMKACSIPEERERPAAQQRICWYHRKHGNAARKHIPPCDYVGNESRRH